MPHLPPRSDDAGPPPFGGDWNGAMVRRAIEAAGGASALATMIGVKPQSVQCWEASGRIPAGRVLAVEASVGISRHELRPDLYPPSVAATPSAQPDFTRMVAELVAERVFDSMLKRGTFDRILQGGRR